jgi:hypothetical protein
MNALPAVCALQDLARHINLVGSIQAARTAAIAAAAHGHATESTSVSLPRRNSTITRVDVMLVLSTLVVMGDIGHVSKVFELHNVWTRRITDEFYRQGDKERAQGLSISPLCDRATGNVSKSQVGFFQYLILPLYRWVAVCLPA